MQDSPFIRKPTKKTSSESIGSATTPLPDQEIPFVSSFRNKESGVGGSQHGGTGGGGVTSSALDNFMKFDEKYSKKQSEAAAAAAAGKFHVLFSSPFFIFIL